MKLCVLSIFALLIAVYHEATAYHDCSMLSKNQLFTVIPQNFTVDVGDSVRFNCSANATLETFVEWEYLLTGDNKADHVFLDKLLPGFSLIGDDLIISNLNASQEGKYICSFLSSHCNSEKISAVATLMVKGPPTFIMPADSYTLNTQDNLEVTSTIGGFPIPVVTIHHVQSDGIRVQLSEEINPRLAISFESATFHFSIQTVLKAEGGTYIIHASNSYGNAEEEFTVTVNGPDPPVLTVKDVVVSSLYSPIQLRCEIQPDAYEVGASIVWTNGMNAMIPVVDDPLTNGVYVKDYRNGTVQLTITSLVPALRGNYKCNATNSRGTVVRTTVVFGPPPPPPFSDISVIVDGSSVIVEWRRPSTVVVVNITKYLLIIYRADESMAQFNGTKPFSPDQSSETFTFSSLEPGKYQVTVASVANDIPGDESERYSFEIASSSLVIIAAAVASGGVFLPFLAIVLGVCVYCCCTSYAHRKQIGSQQQRWGSDEENVANQNPASMKTYTALALNDNPELPPSPVSTILTHSVGVDPKWEFPRENIQIFEKLAGGQFTVLHKGIARGFKDNRSCEVAVKSLRDGATEDDLKALLYEMDMLASIEDHPDIVSLVRVCSVGKPILMIMEYMCHGDLLGFLRSCRGHPGMYTVSPGHRYQTPTLQLCSRDLLNMATKIASGMCYLSDRKIVHRALCAKNILVGMGMDVKIYNVGSFDEALERDDGVKLMAPESLFDGTNTIYSDVWSFGVTMWELVTVGGVPYVDISPEELYTQLQSGMRMSCPPHCALEVYEIMCACWKKNPTDRPHFAIIHENLDELVMSKLSYIDLRSYDSLAYSQFGSEPPLSTAL